jgi:hypothetical protein
MDRLYIMRYLARRSGRKSGYRIVHIQSTRVMVANIRTMDQAVAMMADMQSDAHICALLDCIVAYPTDMRAHMRDMLALSKLVQPMAYAHRINPYG